MITLVIIAEFCIKIKKDNSIRKIGRLMLCIVSLVSLFSTRIVSGKQTTCLPQHYDGFLEQLQDANSLL